MNRAELLKLSDKHLTSFKKSDHHAIGKQHAKSYKGQTFMPESVTRIAQNIQ